MFGVKQGTNLQEEAQDTEVNMKADEEDGKEEEGGREVQEGEEYENEIEGKLDKLGKQRKK